MSHQQLFLPERPESVPANEYALAQAEGCNVCHDPLNNTPMAKCKSCHGDLMLEQHPFHDGPVSGLSPDIVSRDYQDGDCQLCHPDHNGGGDPREDGFIPLMNETQETCAVCHAGTKLATSGFASSRSAQPVGTEPREFDAYRFPHSAHVIAPEGREPIPCGTCHKEDAEAKRLGEIVGLTEGNRLKKDYEAVSFERCAECHVQKRGADGGLVDERSKAVEPWWASAESTWVVDWHGTENQENCARCHTEVSQPEIRSVPRWDVPDAAYATVKARYNVEYRSHSPQFEAHSQGRACSDCHPRAETLSQGVKVTSTFWHGVHMAASLNPGDRAEKLRSSEECAACHNDRAESVTLLADGAAAASPQLYQWAPAEVCGSCHRQGLPGGDGAPLPPEPAGAPAPPATNAVVQRPDFPHKYHLDFSADGPLADGCFTCHEFGAVEGGPAFASIPKTKPEASDCTTCHAKHQNVAGGACQECHPMDPPERYNVYLGGAATSERPLPTKAWPKPNTFNHFSIGHVERDCAICHVVTGGDAGKNLSMASTLEAVHIPDESDASCRDCHLEKQQRFHWR